MYGREVLPHFSKYILVRPAMSEQKYCTGKPINTHLSYFSILLYFISILQYQLTPNRSPPKFLLSSY